jgi:hypothetical protein
MDLPLLSVVGAILLAAILLFVDIAGMPVTLVPFVAVIGGVLFTTVVFCYLTLSNRL